MAIEKVINYQIADIRKEAECYIQVSKSTYEMIQMAGGRRFEASIFHLSINRKVHEIGHMPNDVCWDTVPLVENAFKLGFELGKRVGANQLKPDESPFHFLPA